MGSPGPTRGKFLSVGSSRWRCEHDPNTDSTYTSNGIRSGCKKCKSKREIRNAFVERNATPEGKVKFLLQYAKNRANHANAPFTVTLQDLLPVPMDCPALRIRLDYKAVGARHDGSASLDRIDPNCGYTAENTRIISWRANRIKSDALPVELRAVLAWMEKELNCPPEPSLASADTRSQTLLALI